MGKPTYIYECIAIHNNLFISMLFTYNIGLAWVEVKGPLNSGMYSDLHGHFFS